MKDATRLHLLLFPISALESVGIDAFMYTSLDESKLYVTEDGFKFIENDGKYYLVAYEGKESDIVLPESCNGNNYEIYRYAFSNCDFLNSVVIPDNVTSIGKSAFESCSNLRSVTVGRGVTSIGGFAFSGCYIKEIVIPDNVVYMGGHLFFNCVFMTVYCEADEVPSEWSSYWDFGVLYVVMGYNSEK
ncbi:MAG: leucine-rich repeat domain-containing protein [Clostridia bacterium]|nr:leucine-rich repeat domain-containing protein [Clostridia bacterium]